MEISLQEILQSSKAPIKNGVQVIHVGKNSGSSSAGTDKVDGASAGLVALFDAKNFVWHCCVRCPHRKSSRSCSSKLPALWTRPRWWRCW